MDSEHTEIVAMFERIAAQARRDGRMWLAAWARVEASKYREVTR